MSFAFDRWDFLTAPLSQVLNACQARVTEVAPPAEEPGGRRLQAGLINRTTEIEIEILADIGPLERDAIIRGLLAAWHGTDTSDWPAPMDLRWRDT
ncbi:hypothetical protein GCM10010387_22630 [Streptomyces inusitatus]|uniref:Uncharacterized protein n=1 Tax=Streptomyces inusitatus TaxID=68221 RepID=A0A918Q1M2_9ACTN|nr:hypothetical protein [Streptomyces inusitatus]GGZ28638.1 hypothetical protein GCM10010387_22630 [Streptomyces inusitatus]